MPIPLPIIKFLIRTGIAQRIPAVKALVPEPSYLRFYSDRILMAPNEPVRDMNSFLERATPDCIDLSLGAPSEAGLRPEPGPPDEQFGAYPPSAGLQDLRTAVLRKLNQVNRIALCGPDEVAITNGVSQAIHVVFDTFVNPGDKIVLVDPTFLVYPLAAQYHRARVAWVHSQLDRGRTVLDPRSLERSMRRAKLVVVNSPSNPTGGTLDRESLERILHLARRNDTLVLSDEVYERFHYDGEHVSMASLPGARERTITVNSFSKSCAMAGSRIGYIGAIRHLLRPMTVHQFIATPFVTLASQKLALRALADHGTRAREVVETYRTRRDWMHGQLQRMGLHCDRPAGAFYFWIPIARFGMTSLEFAHELFDAEQVLLMPGENFGPSGLQHVRISYAASQPKLDEGCARIRRFVQTLGTSPVAAFADRLGRVDSGHHTPAPHRSPSHYGTEAGNEPQESSANTA